jgi:hypothetical protein
LQYILYFQLIFYVLFDLFHTQNMIKMLFVPRCALHNAGSSERTFLVPKHVLHNRASDDVYSGAEFWCARWRYSNTFDRHVHQTLDGCTMKWIPNVSIVRDTGMDTLTLYLSFVVMAMGRHGLFINENKIRASHGAAGPRRSITVSDTSAMTATRSIS